MKRHLSKIVGLLFLILFVGIGSQAVAEEKGKVLDLIFKVEDMGGKVQDLQVKETATEIHIELAADVLFDFDKANIKAQAAATLKQAASVIRDKAKGAVRIEGHTDAKGSDAPLHHTRVLLEGATRSPLSATTSFPPFTSSLGDFQTSFYYSPIQVRRVLTPFPI